MAVWRRLLENFTTDERGLETIEYAIMAAVIVTGVVVTVGIFVGTVSSVIGNVVTAIGLL